MQMHLAQLNIAKARYPTDDKRMEGFTGRIDAINALADRSPGFVWRLTDGSSETDGALDLRLPGASDMLVNLSVWEDLQSFFNFAYNTAHSKLIRDRAIWFESLGQPHLVLWWIEHGHIPTLEEASGKLRQLDDYGSTPQAFTLSQPFGAAGAPMQLNLKEAG